MFFDALLERLAALPQVRAASASSQYPPMAAFDIQVKVERSEGANESDIPSALITVTTPRYFEALRVPMRSGRSFGATDSLNAPPVAIVNQAFVDRYLGEGEAIGRRIALGSPNGPRPWTTIVGVAADHRNAGATRAVRPEVYTPVRQQTDWNQLFLMVGTDGNPTAVLPSVHEAIKSLDPEQPVYLVRTLEAAVAEASFQQSLAALPSLDLAAVDLVAGRDGDLRRAVLTVAPAPRESGSGWRWAPNPRHLRWLVVRQVLMLTGAGLAIGTGILLAGGRVLTGLLFGVEVADPATLVAAAVILGTVALAAAWLPALRATRVDPIQAFRME